MAPPASRAAPASPSAMPSMSPRAGGRGAEGGGEQVGEQGGGDLVADVGLYVCSYPLAEHAELSVFVVGGASVGHGVRGVEFGD
jgi:hypothetical protein